MFCPRTTKTVLYYFNLLKISALESKCKIGLGWGWGGVLEVVGKVKGDRGVGRGILERHSYK